MILSWRVKVKKITKVLITKPQKNLPCTGPQKNPHEGSVHLFFF
jgi:hypothetical protein